MDGEIQLSTLPPVVSPGSCEIRDADPEPVADAFAPLRALLQSEDSDEDAQADVPQGDASHDELDWYRGGVEDSPDNDAEGDDEADAVASGLQPVAGKSDDGLAPGPLPASSAFAPQLDQSYSTIKKVKKDKKEKKQKKNGEKDRKKEQKQNKVQAEQRPEAVTIAAAAPISSDTAAALARTAVPATLLDTNGGSKKAKKEKKGEKTGKKEKKEKKAILNLQNDPIKSDSASKRKTCEEQVATENSILEMEKKKAKLRSILEMKRKTAKLVQQSSNTATGQSAGGDMASADSPPEMQPTDITASEKSAGVDMASAQSPPEVQSSNRVQTGETAGGVQSAQAPPKIQAHANTSTSDSAGGEDDQGATVKETTAGNTADAAAEATQSAQVEAEAAPAEGAEDELVFAGGLRNVLVPLEASPEELHAAEPAKPADTAAVSDGVTAEESEQSELVFDGGLRNLRLPDDLLAAEKDPAAFDAPGVVAASSMDAPEVIDIDSDDSPTAEDASALFEALVGTSASGPVVEVLKSGRGSRNAAAKLVPQVDPASSEQGTTQEHSLLGNASMLDDYASPLDNYVNEELPAAKDSHPAEVTPAEPGDVVGNASMLDDFAGNASMLDDYDAGDGRGNESPLTPTNEVEAAAAGIVQHPPGHLPLDLSVAVPAVTPALFPPQRPSVLHHSKSGLQAKTAALVPPSGPVLQHQLNPPLALPPPPPPPPTAPPLSLSMVQPPAAVQSQPIVGNSLSKSLSAAAPAAVPKGLKHVADGLPLVRGGGIACGNGLPGALPKSIEMHGPAPKKMALQPPEPSLSSENAPLPLEISISSTPPGTADASAQAPSEAATGQDSLEMADDADEEEPEESVLLGALEVLQSILPSPEEA